jgi:hypothetical protein
VISHEDDIFLSEDEIYNKEKKCETRWMNNMLRQSDTHSSRTSYL